MEKTKDIPRWYQRLLNAERNPASRITFKQYYEENGTRMKILCPFLPLDQIKGKIYSQWKRKQPPETKTQHKSGAKAQKKILQPVVHFFPQKMTNNTIQSTTKSVAQLDWLKLKEASSKPGRKDCKTYKGRAFELSPKVPEVISQSSTIEQSILKGGRAEAESSRQKRQLTSRVSFNTENGGSSPSLCSPPTPFVLSPASQGDPMEEEITKGGPPQPESLVKSPLKVMSKNVKHFKKPINQVPEQRRKMEHGKPGSTFTHGCSPRNKEENTALKVHPQNIPKQSKKVVTNAGIGKKIRKFTRGMPEFPEADLDFVLSPSQYLEPPEFGTPACQTPDQNKQFCLFEDELITMSNPPKATSKNPKKKSPHTRSKCKKYSWSPALSANSQQTHKLKKSKHSFCSQEKPETYYKVKHHKTGAIKRNKTESVENTKEKSHILRGAAGRRTSRMKKNSPRNSEIVKKINDSLRSVCSLYSLPTDASVEDEIEDQGICNKNPLKTFTKEGETTKMKTDQKGSAQKTSRRRDCRLSRSTTASKESQRSKPFQQNEEGSCFSEFKNKSLRSTKDKQKMNKAVDKTKKDKFQAYLNRDQEKEQGHDFQWSNMETRQENKSPKICPPLHNAHETDSNVLATTEENNHSPETLASGMNVLRNILCQLKSPAASTQSPTNLESSPAQSRLTEISEMSMKSPSSCAPSPAVQEDLVDYFGPTVAEEFPVNDVVSVMNTASGYRKRGNILCNMFDAADSTDSEVPAKMKRNLTNTTEGHFSVLFNDRTII